MDPPFVMQMHNLTQVMSPNGLLPPISGSPLAPPSAADASDFLGDYGEPGEKSGLMSPSGLGVFDDEHTGQAGEEGSFYNVSDVMEEGAAEWAANSEAAAAGAVATPKRYSGTRERTAAGAAAEPEQHWIGRGRTAAGDAIRDRVLLLLSG